MQDRSRARPDGESTPIGCEWIVELARRVDSNASARRPIDEATVLALPRAVLELQGALKRWDEMLRVIRCRCP